jgi:threonine dehydrogenase-like Zn-dependent dehydrogenase
VGVDAQHSHHGPGAKAAKEHAEAFAQEQETVAPKQNPQGENWHPGDAPSQALRWGVEALAKAGTHSIIGVYPETAQAYPIGKAMNKNLTIKAGNCNHRRYVPHLVELVRRGMTDPLRILTKAEPLLSAIDAYRHFDRHEPGWLKVELLPQAQAAE